MQCQEITWPSEFEKDLKYMTGKMVGKITCEKCHTQTPVALEQAEAGETVKCAGCNDLIKLRIKR